MALRRYQLDDVRRSPAPKPIRRASATTVWLADNKYAWLTAMMIATMFLTLIVPMTLYSGEVNEYSKIDSSLFYRLLKFILIVLSFGIIIWRFALARGVLREVNPFFSLTIGLALLSLEWSIEPGDTLQKSGLLIQVSLVCAAFVMVGWHDRRLQNVIRPLLTTFLVASLIFGLLNPRLGRENLDLFALKGAWRGVFVQKNALGAGASLGVIFWVHAYLAKETRFWRFALGLSASVACLLLSRSSTSLFGSLFGAFLLLLLMRGHSLRRRYVVPLSVLFVGLIMFYSLAVLKIVPGDSLIAPIVGAAGKDLTFTGRTRVWAVVREHIKLHPMLGTGYGAYWIGPVARSPSIETMDRYSDYYPTQAHNGYLDVLNDLGYVGLVSVVGFIVVLLRQCLELLRFDQPQGVLYLVLFFEALISNLTSSDWFVDRSTDFAYVILMTFALARAALDRRLRAKAAVQSPNRVASV